MAVQPHQRRRRTAAHRSPLRALAVVNGLPGGANGRRKRVRGEVRDDEKKNTRGMGIGRQAPTSPWVMIPLRCVPSPELPTAPKLPSPAGTGTETCGLTIRCQVGSLFLYRCETVGHGPHGSSRWATTVWLANRNP